MESRDQRGWYDPAFDNRFRNDLNDVTALAIAVPYCDVVITEKSWASMLCAAKVPERSETTVTGRLRDMADRLA